MASPLLSKSRGWPVPKVAGAEPRGGAPASLRPLSALRPCIGRLPRAPPSARPGTRFLKYVGVLCCHQLRCEWWSVSTAVSLPNLSRKSKRVQFQRPTRTRSNGLRLRPAGEEAEAVGLSCPVGPHRTSHYLCKAAFAASVGEASSVSRPSRHSHGPICTEKCSGASCGRARPQQQQPSDPRVCSRLEADPTTPRLFPESSARSQAAGPSKIGPVVAMGGWFAGTKELQKKELSGEDRCWPSVRGQARDLRRRRSPPPPSAFFILSAEGLRGGQTSN